MFKNKTLGYYAIYLVITVLLICGYGVAQEVVISTGGGGGGVGGYPAVTSPNSTVSITGSGTSALTLDVNTNTIQTQAMLQYLDPITFTATLAGSTYTGSVSPAIAGLIDGASNPVFINMCPASNWTGGAVSLALNSLTTHSIKISNADPSSTQLVAGSCYLIAWNPTAVYYEVLSLPSGGLGSGSTNLTQFVTSNNDASTNSLAAATINWTYIPLTGNLPTTKISFSLATPDNSNNSDVGIYSGVSGGTCNLLGHIGAQHLGSSGVNTINWTAGFTAPAVTSTARTYLAVASVQTTLSFNVGTQEPSLVSGGNLGGGTVTGGALPATATCPTDNPYFGSASKVSAIIY